MRFMFAVNQTFTAVRNKTELNSFGSLISSEELKTLDDEKKTEENKKAYKASLSLYSKHSF